MRRNFDAAITAYREAQRLCQRLSGDTLYAARDEEAEALDVLARTPSESLGDSARSSMCCRGSCRKDVGLMGVTSCYSTAFGGT